MARIACIMVADFSLAALVRSNPAFESSVLAIGRSLAPHAELETVSVRARETGIRAGMTIAQARAVSSDLIVAHRSPAAESSAHSALLDAAESISPVVEGGAPGCVWLDLAGLHRIYNDENEIAAELVKQVRRVGMAAAIGIAANKDLAHLAARCKGVRIIEAGREREFLDWIPLDMLALGKSERGDDLELTLARWGMRRLGELARLNPDAVGTRLGRQGVELVRLARGGNQAPIVARRRAEFFSESIELDYGIENLEPLAFVMRPMLERLTERLAIRGLVAGDITLAFGMSGHRNFSRRIAIAASSNDVRAILTLINLSLEAAPPEVAVESIRIDIEPRVPRPAQTDMFIPPAPAPDKLQTTIARLTALCGPGNVGALSAENSHRPGAMRVEPFAPPAAPLIPADAPLKNVTQLVIRTIRPAREIEVMCTRAIPEFIRGENLGARVISIAGPWRRDGEWWKNGASESPACAAPQQNQALHAIKRNGGPPFGQHPREVTAHNLKSFAGSSCAASSCTSENGSALNSSGQTHDENARTESAAERERGFIRDYYELALEDGGVYRVFRDVNSDQWFLDGSYD
ncbi:MAG: DNA polymerase Y family protein [Candidatus Binatus sp.]|uniref:DNA polymerase Y family protein n=1 Tax=Candidatus Binatus sp. TaxID=2811406 RepID=UPI00271CF37C|nr:DNA polymerase Y family protein [Candidatus Binatus sp.]MDO8433922.1 DNA polymerase Y family protein [Candidatus Binatus sp.]